VYIIKDDFSLKDELIRKSVHIMLSLVIVFYYIYGKGAVLGLLFVALTVSLSIEYLRIKKGFYLTNTFRDSEKNKLAAHIYSIIGTIIAIYLYSMPIASAAILMAAFGDASAAIVGKAYGKNLMPKTKSKTFEGVITEFVVNLFIGIIIVQNIYIALIMSFTATFVETYLTGINDNVSIPVISGLFGEIAINAIV